MTTWFVSRHPGAVEWVVRQSLEVHRQVAHLNLDDIQTGDTVIGSLPVNLAAKVCALGATYWHLSLEVPAHLRGKELDADALQHLGARLESFQVQSNSFHTHTPL